MICSYKVKLKDGQELFFKTDEEFSAYLAGDGAFLVKEYEVSQVVEEGTKIVTKEDVLKKIRSRKSKKSGPSEGRDFSENNDLYRKLVEGVYEQLDTEEIDWFKNTFADYPIILKTVSTLINSDAWGQFTTDATFLYEAAQKGTAYHEAWHNFTQLFLSKDDKYRLYNEVRKLDNLDLTDKEIEEYLADKFMDFANSKGTELPFEPVRKNLFQKIWDFIKALFGEKSIDVNKLFTDLYSGNLNGYNYDKANAIWGTLNATVKDKNGNQVLSVEQANILFNYFDTILGDWLNTNNLYYNNLLTKDGKELETYVKALKEDIDAYVDETYELLSTKADNNIINSQELVMLDKLIDFMDNKSVKNTIFNSWLSTVTSAKIKQEAETETETETGTNDDQDQNDLSQEEIEEIDQRTGEFAQKSVIDMATKETKALIRMIAKVEVDENGMPLRDNGQLVLSRNSHGLTEAVNYSNFFNRLSFLLADSLNFEEMVEKMKDPDNQLKMPELALLLERLKFEYVDEDGVIDYVDEGEMTEFKRQLRSSFERDFNKSYVGVFDSTINRTEEGDLVHYFNEETKQGLDFLKKKFFDNFMSLPTGSFIGKLEDGRNYVKKEFVAVIDRFVDKAYPSKDNMIKDFLTIMKYLGVELSAQTINSTELKQLLGDKRNLDDIVVNIKERLNQGQELIEPLTDLSKPFSTVPTISSFIYRILSTEAKFNNETTSLSYLTATGTKKYALMNPSLLFTVMNRMKAVKKNISELINIPQFSYLSPKNNESIKTSLVMNSLFNLDESSEYYGNRRKVRDYIQLEFGDYNGFKTNMDGKEIRKQTTSLTIREKIIMDMNNLLNKGYIDIMRTEASASSYFYKLSHYLHKDEKGSWFASEMLPFNIDLMYNKKRRYEKALYDYLWNLYEFEKKDGLAVFADIIKTDVSRKDFEVKMKEFFKNETAEFIKYAAKQGVNGKNILSKQLMEKFEMTLNREPNWSEIVAPFILNDFILNIEYTKLISGSAKYYKSYHKRAKIAISTGIPMSTSKFVKEHLDRTHARTMQYALNPASRQTDEFTYKASTVEDEMYKIDDALISSWRRAIKNFREEKFKAYEAATATDGQGRITLDGYREFRIRTGNWGIEEEATYLREVYAWKIRKGIKPTTEDLQRLKHYDSKKVKSVRFGVIKAQYAGHAANVNGHKPVAHKFSLAPLIPSVIEGTPMDSFNDDLLNANIQYFTHESGSKIFKGKVTKLGEQPEAQDFYAGFLKEQLPTKSEAKEESTWGSQMRKLFLANMFNEGVANEKFEGIYNEYVDLLERIERNERDKLYKDFGITEENGMIKIKDVKPFLDTLMAQINSRDLNENLKESIQYDETSKQFKYPLEINLNRIDIINLISGMIDSRLRRINVAGDQLTLISPNGLMKEGEKLRFYEPEFNEKGEFIRTKPMQVKIGFSDEYLPLLELPHPDGRKISTRQRLNEAIKNSEWLSKHESSVTLVGYRIPTQGPNSMEFMVVQEFLPETFYGIIPPEEFVVKSGADYDIDKLYVMRFTLNNAGLVSKYNNSPMGLEKLNTIKFLLKRGFREELNEMEMNRMEQIGIDALALSKDFVGFNKFKTELLNYYRTLPEFAEDIENLVLAEQVLKSDIETFRMKYKGFTEYAGVQTVDMYNELIRQREEVLAEIRELKKALNKKITSSRKYKQEVRDRLNNYLQDKFDTDFVDKLNYIETKRDPKNQLMNDVISIYKEVLSSPEMFEQLVTPNSSQQVRDVAVYIGQLLNLQGIDEIVSKVDAKNTKIFKSVTNYNKFFENLSGRSDLGAWAVNSTLSQLLQQAGVKMNPKFVHWFDTSKQGRQALIMSNSQLLLGERDLKLTLSALFNTEGKLKQEIISELINATVDIAADPFYAYLGVNNENKGAFIFLLQQGVPLKKATLFINQPVLRKYYQNRVNQPFIDMEGIAIPSTSKFQKQGLGLDEMTKKSTFLKTVDDLTNSAIPFNEEELESYIKKGYGKDAQVMAYFIKLTIQAKMFRNMQMSNSYDTTKYATPLAAVDNKNIEADVDNSKMFTNYKNIKEKSLISVFDNRDTLVSVFETLFPYGYSAKLIDFYRSFNPKIYSRKEREKFEKVVAADFIEFILKNYVQINGIPLGTYGSHLMNPPKGKKALYETMLELHTEIPELKQTFELFNKLLTNFEREKPYRKNLEILRGLDNTSDYQNLLIEEYKRLLNFTGDMVNRELPSTQILKVRKFMTDLAYLGFAQSGFNKSKLFFTDIIPNEVLQQLFTTALEKFKKQGNLDYAMANFRKRFVANNGEFFGRGKGQTYRGKDYSIKKELPNRNLDINDNECK